MAALTATMPKSGLSRGFVGGMMAAGMSSGKRFAGRRSLQSNDNNLEDAEDENLFALAEERLKNDSGKTYSFEDILAEDGLSLDDLDNMEDVEIE